MAVERSALLLQEHVELRLALCNVLGTGVGALCLLPHVVNLQGEDAQAIRAQAGLSVLSVASGSTFTSQ